MAIQLTHDEKARFSALRRVAQAFPDDKARAKAAKKSWWAEMRRKYKIPNSAKLRVVLPSGVIKDSRKAHNGARLGEAITNNSPFPDSNGGQRAWPAPAGMGYDNSASNQFDGRRRLSNPW